jgi:hypothetical protein
MDFEKFELNSKEYESLRTFTLVNLEN